MKTTMISVLTAFILVSSHLTEGNMRIGHGNLAQGNTAKQSSTAHLGSASRAVDGKKGTCFHSGSCTHTYSQQNAWWRVDLGDDYKVGIVKITNRGDCCSDRLKNFEIRVGNVGNDPKQNKLCKYHSGSVSSGGTITLNCDGSNHGRYVYVMLRGKDFLTLCEVEVYSKKETVKNGYGNLAQGKDTWQSSTSHSGSASRAVDGKKGTDFHSGSCTHTYSQQNAWWRVDLGDDYKVGMVKITNRGDCCSDRLRNPEIRVGNIDGSPKANELCSSQSDSVPPGATLSLNCKGDVHGHFVYVMLQGKNYLTLCEVEVYSEKMKNTDHSKYGAGNLARGKNTWQSTTAHSGSASRAVDGNKGTDFHSGSCTHTKSQQNAWWGVDLGADYKVGMVKITNRGDIKYDRLKNFAIYVGNVERNPKQNEVCNHVPGSVAFGVTKTVICDGDNHGRYVYVMLRGTDYLTLCEVEVYSRKGEDCKATKVHVSSGSSEAKEDGEEIIGIATAGSCSKSPVPHYLTIAHTQDVIEEIGIETSKTDEVNWGVSASVTVEVSGKVFGVGASVSASVGSSFGESTSFTSSKSKSTSSGSSKGSAANIYYNTPGGAMVVGFVKKYRFDKSTMPAKVTVTCSNKYTYQFETTVKLTSTTYGKAFYHSFLGKFDDGKCTTARVNCLYNMESNSYRSVMNAGTSFATCFPSSIGKVLKR